MKPIQFLPIVMIATAGLVASCSTSKLAQTKPVDDVYNSVAKAREVEIVRPPQNQQAQNQNNGQEEYDEYYGTSNPYYDMDYSSRINRFHNGYSFQGYYDPYFDNYYYGNSYGPSNYLGIGLGWNSGYGLGWGGGFGYGGGWGYGSIWNNPFYYGNMGFGWNNPWGWNAWGPNSYYDRYGWGGGYYGGGWGIGGGYYGGGVYTNSNFRPRPGSNDRGVPRYGNGNNGNVGRPSRSGVVNQNGVSYAPNNNAGRPVRSQGGYSQNDGMQSGRPTRNNNYSPQQGSQSSRPTRNEGYTPPARTESRPTYSPPPSSYGGGGGGSTGGGGGGGSRPSRAGRG
ncbi:hypothetical protein SAMN05421827_11464 [Pedobacter terrae]|uniref:Prolyl-tRNA synthetase n=1 Tax=Pedobacter terrae TaxID=405671 RepID=A0A1G7YS09_9SPHI|nr:hypothetical protein [Pedobacter terrae]SDG99135.1 hypothetical protein SAMN05421827_11464 [Pedobacter terrae]